MAGTIIADTLQDGSANSGSMTDAIKGSAKAWVNFNGTGTVAVIKAYNVSSITDVSTGAYNVNFTNDFTDSDYLVSISSALSSGLQGNLNTADSALKTPSTCRVDAWYPDAPATRADANNLYCVFFE